MRSTAWMLLPSLLLACSMATPASAEWFADGYVGLAITSNHDLTFEAFGGERTEDADLINAAVIGLRLGRWFEELPWLAVAGDISYFRPGRDTETIPMSVLAMFRYGFLKDAEFKDGRLQPYVGIGPALFFSHVHGRIGPVRASDSSLDIGLDTRLGAAYRFDQSWAAFVEYRFTHVSPTFEVRPDGSPRTNADTSFNTNHLAIGVSYRF
jgi:opacity protein-like surface antigen